MSAAFTPGPWHVRNSCGVNASGGRSIAIATPNPKTDDGSMGANARLIAAAPEQHEALEPFALAAADYDREGPDAWSDEDDCADVHFTVGQLRRAAAAYAKARGGQ